MYSFFESIGKSPFKGATPKRLEHFSVQNQQVLFWFNYLVP